MKKSILYSFTIVLFLISCNQSFDENILNFEKETLELIIFNKETKSPNNRTTEFLETNSEKYIQLKEFLSSRNENWQENNLEISTQPNYSIIGNKFQLNTFTDFIILKLNHSNSEFIQTFSKGQLDFLKKGNVFLHEYDNYLGQGIIKKDSYSFCSTVPVYIDYEYKFGEWTFWTKERQLIAKGIFTIEKELSHSSCPQDINVSKIHEKYWTFYDEEGNITTATKELIHELEKRR